MYNAAAMTRLHTSLIRCVGLITLLIGFLVPSLAHADTGPVTTTSTAISAPLIPDTTLAVKIARPVDPELTVAVAARQAGGLTLTPPAPGTNWAILNYYNLHSSSFAQVVLNKVTTISLIGKYSGVSIDLYAFAGVDDKYKTAVAGLGLVHSWHVANTSAGPIQFTFGVGASGGGQKGSWGAGPIIGLSLTF